jgi:hypothetical protein
MARPSATILNSMELDDGTKWEVLHADSFYVISYKNKPCGVRQHKNMVLGFKYMKLSYTNLGNAMAQANRLNKKFNTTDFDVMQVT